MRNLLRTVALSLALAVGASLPAAADPGDRDSRDWSDGGPRYFYTGPVERPQARHRSGNAVYEHPRRSHRAQGHYTKPQHATRTARKARRHTIARKHTRGHRVAIHRKAPKVAAHQKAPKVATPRERPVQKPAVQKPAPSVTQRPPTPEPRSAGQHGIASYYWQGQRVASGGWFNPNALTAAHRTLPFGTRVRVTHLGNGRTVEVTINDRGPFIAGRIIDLSKAAAGVIGMTGQGIARVSVEVLGRGSTASK